MSRAPIVFAEITSAPPRTAVTWTASSRCTRRARAESATTLSWATVETGRGTVSCGVPCRTSINAAASTVVLLESLALGEGAEPAAEEGKEAAVRQRNLEPCLHQ